MKKIKLFLAAFAAMVSLGVNAQTWTGNEPAAGTFYLYNVGAAKFINNGDPAQEWGTNAYLQAGFGIDFVLEANGAAYNLNTNVSNGGANNYLGTSTWCDGAATPWTFTAVDGLEKTYTISNGSSYLVANDALNDIVYGASTGDSKSYWKLVSEADFKTAMQAKTYSTTDPMDVSIFIKGRSFARNDGRNSSWTTTHNGGNWTWIGGSANKYYGNESWNNTFEISQTITGLPDGTYEVQCSGFGTNGTTYIYGNTTSKALQSDNTTDRGTNAAAKWTAIHEDNAFAGQTTGTFTLSGGELTVGLKRETNKSADWCIWDEFRLYYYGIDISEFASALATAVSAAQATEGTVPTACYSAINAVVTEYNKEYSTAAEYGTATNAINTAVSTYASTAIVADYSRYNTIKAAALAINEGLSTTGADEAVEAATTTDAIDAAIATLRSAFVAAIGDVEVPEDPGYIDVTAVMVDNASVSENTNYWTAEENGSERTGYSWGVCNYGECEFYQQNFKFYQTLGLNVGTWEFGVTGFHRAGNHSTYFYAGSSKVLIPGVESTVVNNMAQAKEYFDAGNGKVSVKFALDQAGNVEIGIDNKDTETDKWTIFRNFTLKYFGEAVDLTAYVEQLAEAVQKAEAVNGTVPAAIYNNLADVVNDNNTTYTTVADYETAISNIETATNNAKAVAVPYAEYKAVKAAVSAMTSVPGYEETTSGAATTLTTAIGTADTEVEKATNTEGIATQVAALKAAGKTFLGGVRSDGEHPFDITFLINNPSFDNNDATGWTVNPAPGFQTYTNCEYYQTEFDINQTLTGMPKGNYELKVQAFQRPGWFDAVYSAYQSGTNNVSSVIYINDGETTIKNLVSEGATTSDAQWANGNDSHSGDAYYANSMNGASKAFAAGNYWNTVLTAVEGDLKFGFKSTKTHVDGDWTIFDNFQLFYYGQSINVAMSETEAFAALADIEGANVTMVRNTKVGFNTVALPFDLNAGQVVDIFGEGAIVYEYSDGGDDADHVTINFNKKAENTIEANVPVLVKSTKAVKEIAVDDVVVKTGEAKVEGTYFDFVGNYSGNITIAEGDYFIGNDAVYKSAGASSIKGFRAYLKAKEEIPAGVKLFIDGQAIDYETAVNGIEAAPAQNGAIYNIAGQRVSKAQKGIFIVNGKKVVK